MSKNESRITLEKADEIVDFWDGFFHHNELDLEIGGSVKRRCETIGDIDLVVKEEQFDKMVECLEEEQLKYGTFDSLHYTKKGKFKLLFYKGIKIEFYVAKRDQFGAMKLFATGSGDFNIRMRKIAQKEGYKLSQYGLFENGSENPIVAPDDDEKWIFDKLKMIYIKPENR